MKTANLSILSNKRNNTDLKVKHGTQSSRELQSETLSFRMRQPESFSSGNCNKTKAENKVVEPVPGLQEGAAVAPSFNTVSKNKIFSFAKVFAMAVVMFLMIGSHAQVFGQTTYTWQGANNGSWAV
jgi:hypothetical protein